MFWILPLIPFITLTLIADIFAKEYSLKGNWYFWALALLGYTIGNVFWLWSIRSGSGLARGALIYLLANVIFVSIVGIYFYGEPTNKIQIAGIALGVVALILIFWE
ncbi:MAG TPA: EamA family transporter [Candidatus Paceibacterota bacterium]|jgi:drug/metabolite transporter (DMT)-like permease|nr:EamA family transporter [Candidatus Paceibacterota bacterium]